MIMFIPQSGFQTTLSLATRGAHVILACRDPIKAEAAIVRILQIKVGHF